jgi:predicted ArsR family transcriptional regulator
MSRHFCPAASDSSASRIIELVVRRGPLTVRELVDAMGLTTTAIREQVNRLRAEGWLVGSKRRGRPGRPADVFAASAKAGRLFAGQMEQLARLMVDEVLARESPQKRRELLRSVGEKMARDVRAQVGGGSARRRLGRLGRLLSEQGTLAEARRTEAGLHLALHSCPFGCLAEGHQEICEMERQTLSDLLGAAARLEKSCTNGHRRCEFTFAEQPDQAVTSQSTERR